MKEKQKFYSENGTTILFKENPFSVIVVTPIMRRAHQIKEAQEIIFVDSTSACDPLNHSITFVMCPSAAGAVPLAIIITMGQTYECYCEGFKLINEAIPESFCGRGYPNIFLTDQSAAEINAINQVWPKSKTLLCTFHVLQAVWRWLWDTNHQIPKEKRKPLMKTFQNILYAESVVEAECAYRQGIENDEFSQWKKYLENYWSYKEDWCLCYRDSTSRGHVTNNYCEVAVRLYKDHALGRVKAYNVLALIDLTSTVLEGYYKRRLREYADSRTSLTRLTLRKMMKKVTFLNKEMIIQENDHEFLVPSEKEQNLLYYVDIKSGICSCPSALTGKFCKHQYAIYQFFSIKSVNFPLITPIDRYNIAKIAFGDKVLDKSFYEPFIMETQREENVSDKYKDEEINVNNTYNKLNDNKENNKLNIDQHRTNYIPETSTNNNKFENVINLLNSCNASYGSSLSGINKLEEKLKKIKTQGQWENFLHTAGNCISTRQRDGARIKVQPTTIARRAVGVTRGSKRLLGGRPPKGENPPKKRKRNLGLNINSNQPNAKSHGS